MQAASLFFVTVCLIIGNMIAMPVLLFIGFVMNEPIKASVILGGLAIGLMIRTPAAILWRVSNLVTKTYGVNAINYLEPLFGLLWLTVLWERQVANFNYLIIGVCTIVAANLLINSRT